MASLRVVERLKARGAFMAVVGSLLTLSGMSMVVGAALAFGTASADTAPYELYCPGTPIGDVVLNDVTTSGTITPADPTPGGTFNLTDYQTNAAIPQVLAEAAQSIETDLTGSATTQIDVTGATPATMAEGPFEYDVPIPTTVPDSGVDLPLPSAPATIGPFTAGSGSITISEDSTTSLSLTVAGSPLT